MKILLLLLIIFSATVQPLFATSILRIDTVQLANDAELVFEGEVLATRSEQAGSGYIYTYVDFLVTDMVLGDAEAGGIITLRFTGGVVGDLTLDVGSDIPSLGERGIYFVEAQDAGLTNPLLGWSQGQFEIQDDGSLMAGNNQRVTGFDIAPTNTPSLSRGVAKGVITTLPGHSSNNSTANKTISPLTVDHFKRIIKSLKQSQ
jgi:hypothetical protein